MVTGGEVVTTACTGVAVVVGRCEDTMGMAIACCTVGVLFDNWFTAVVEMTTTRGKLDPEIHAGW